MQVPTEVGVALRGDALTVIEIGEWLGSSHNRGWINRLG